MKLILASTSPRRKELLSWLGLLFEVVESEVDETKVQVIEAEKRVKLLAEMKAVAVKGKVRSGLVLGADTLVTVGGEMVGKPEHEDDARRILRLLSGRTHEVYTGVVALDVFSGEEASGVEKTEVTFRELGDEEIESYITSGEPMGKGGAYAIQGKASTFVAKIEGSYTNVVGLPLILVVDLLGKMGLRLIIEPAEVIFEKTGKYRS